MRVRKYESIGYKGGSRMIQGIEFKCKKRALRVVAMLRRSGRNGFIETFIDDNMNATFIVFYKAKEVSK